jgi:hypothetical protein
MAVHYSKGGAQISDDGRAVARLTAFSQLFVLQWVSGRYQHTQTSQSPPKSASVLICMISDARWLQECLVRIGRRTIQRSSSPLFPEGRQGADRDGHLDARGVMSC